MYDVFAGRRVLITGHTGFKGSWLAQVLIDAGADVTGYALEPEASSMFRALDLESSCRSEIADIRDAARVNEVVTATKPDFVFHLAAQPLVLDSYNDPIGTLSTNVMGTANVLEALRLSAHPCVVVVVTSDKCYENREWVHAYRETDHLGGHDLYSASKGAAEIVVAAFRRSFFATSGQIRVATSRAGNVIGGGDWTQNRIVPDCIRSLRGGQPISVRNPNAIRPWQHVLDALSGYLLLATKLAGDDGASYCEAWNFGPADEARSVRDLVSRVVARWGSGTWRAEPREQPHEAHLLRLAIEKAQVRLGWKPAWDFEAAVDHTVDWYKAADRMDAAALRELTRAQIAQHVRAEEASNDGR
ncbi:MAG TPA: CDP-glucose 4,6-dehydratase [Thermoanaerobaculia bacterium]